MVEPEKPFACTMPDCGKTFTNEDHLHVHTKKHDMVLQFGMEQKAAFVADQTPTPTRFIRNCEEVGLFQDLQNVNPFDEGFKRAMETKQGILSLESGMTTPSSTDDLHTPQMVFPLIDPGDSVYTTNNHRNITISRSSSDESGAIKEFETTTISKLTNEVTTISRIVEKQDQPNPDEKVIKNNSVSYTNNFIKIHSNVEIRKDVDKSDFEKKDAPPIMSQRSIDFVVDSLTTDFEKEKKEDYEVLIKLPTGKQIKLTSSEEIQEKRPTKQLLKQVLTEKVEAKSTTNVVPVININGGTLIPVSIVKGNIVTPKMPLKMCDKPGKRKNVEKKIVDKTDPKQSVLDSKCAASKRYRARLKESMLRQSVENKHLKEMNEKLVAEVAFLKTAILEHMKKCPDSDDFRELREKIKQTSNFKS